MRQQSSVPRPPCALLTEVARIKDARMARIPPAQRPHYAPKERMSILAVRAQAHWNAAATARVFQVSAATIANWTKRVDEGGQQALLDLSHPVNKLPDYYALVVQQLASQVPSFGKVRKAQLLARAGLVLAASTVERLQERKLPPEPPSPPESNAPESNAPPAEAAEASGPEAATPPRRHGVRARHAHHVWNVDMTLVPIVGGFWTAWLPFSVPQCWPFCWWVCAVMDQHSRVVLAKGVFKAQPSAEEVCRVLSRAVEHAATPPKHIISDQGAQFQNKYRAWCKCVGAKPRFGAVGKSGSIAFIERFWLSMKNESFRIIHVPFSVQAMCAELDAYITWYNEHRPHQALDGATPIEKLRGYASAPSRLDLEARAPPVLVVTPFRRREHLPIVQLAEAA